MNKEGGSKGGKTLRDRRGEILFCDLRTWDQNIETYTYDKGKRKKKIVLTAEQIAHVKAIYESWQIGDGYEDVPELCKSVKLEGESGIAERRYTLTPSKYIEFVDHDLDIDYPKEMSRIQDEMRGLLAEEKKSQADLEAAFKGIGYGIE